MVKLYKILEAHFRNTPIGILSIVWTAYKILWIGNTVEGAHLTILGQINKSLAVRIEISSINMNNYIS